MTVQRRDLALILLAGLALRLALLMTPRSFFPDEIFQYLEPAHRLAFGSGVVTWEYRYGIRSWLVPVALADAMRLGALVSPGSNAYLLSAKIGLVLVSLCQIGAAARIGGVYSARHGLFAAGVLAIWSETALFGTQALTEAIAMAPLLAGAALMRPGARPRAMIAAGALLALAGIVRFQYAPAIAVYAVLTAGRSGQRWTMLAIGAALASAGGAMLDLAMGGLPFGWVWENYNQNIVHVRSHAWVDGPLYYPLSLFVNWGLALPAILGLAVHAGRRQPALFWCAIANIAVHTLIAHKEYRYILLSTTILVMLAAIGTVDALTSATARKLRIGPVEAAIAWLLASCATAALAWPAAQWTRVTPDLRAFATLRSDAGLCGLAIVGRHWTDTGGYTYLHRAVPIYTPDKDALPPGWVATGSPAFNAVLAPVTSRAAIPDRYRLETCFARSDGAPGASACVFRRAGGCDPSVARSHEINAMLRRTDH